MDQQVLLQLLVQLLHFNDACWKCCPTAACSAACSIVYQSPCAHHTTKQLPNHSLQHLLLLLLLLQQPLLPLLAHLLRG
jgi:hypothetical protein